MYIYIHIPGIIYGTGPNQNYGTGPNQNWTKSNRTEPKRNQTASEPDPKGNRTESDRRPRNTLAWHWQRQLLRTFSELRLDSRTIVFLLTWHQNMSAYSAGQNLSTNNHIASRSTEVFSASAMYS